MKRIIATGITIIVFLVAAIARAEGAANGAKIADIAWGRSNIDILHSFNADDVFEFVSQMKEDPNYDVIRTSHSGIDSRALDGFTWADLTRNDEYRLVVVFEPPGTSLTNVVVIYGRNSSGKISSQVISGDGISLNGDPNIDAPKLIQDLDGDGKDEFVVPKGWGGILGSSRVIIPKVYRLSDGNYVEASRDFPRFYDTQVLPKLETEISQANNEAPHNGSVPPELTTPQQIDEWRSQPARNVAQLEMKRDKILRLLGRDPNADEKQAREWLKSSDPELIADSIIVFEDMGGHEADLRAAKLAMRRLQD